MSTPVAAAKRPAKTAKKRGQGRPTSPQGVGREMLITAARALLQEVTPGRLTASLVAQRAGADPALVRYYFGDRTGLLAAVVESMLDTTPPPHAPGDDNADDLAVFIRRTFQFTQSAKHMHRLMIEELGDAKSPEARERLRRLNQWAIDRNAELLTASPDNPLRSAEPLMLHLAVIGMCDFFASAQPVIRSLLSDEEDPAHFAQRFEDFIVGLVLDGLRKR